MFLAPVDAPRRELFVCSFKSVVALLVSRRIDFLCVHTRCPIQLYEKKMREAENFFIVVNLDYSLTMERTVDMCVWITQTTLLAANAMNFSRYKTTSLSPVTLIKNPALMSLTSQRTQQAKI